MESIAFSAMVNAEQEDRAFFGWGTDYPDPDNWLPEFFGIGAGVGQRIIFLVYGPFLLLRY
jgi:oligopeptide transport system substrate-binding protein